MSALRQKLVARISKRHGIAPCDKVAHRFFGRRCIELPLCAGFGGPYECACSKLAAQSPFFLTL